MSVLLPRGLIVARAWCMPYRRDLQNRLNSHILNVAETENRAMTNLYRALRRRVDATTITGEWLLRLLARSTHPLSKQNVSGGLIQWRNIVWRGNVREAARLLLPATQQTNWQIRIGREVIEVGRFRGASRSQGGGWAFSVLPCLDQSLSKRPIETPTLQYVYLALVSVSEETVPHLSQQQADCFYVPPGWQAVIRMRSGQCPTADHLLGGSSPLYVSHSWSRCVMRSHLTPAHSRF